MVERMYDRFLEALTTAALALAIVAGSAFIWIGLPTLGFWVGGQLTTSAEMFLLFVLGSVPLAMVGFGWLLYRVAATYERLRGRGGAGGSPRDPPLPRRARPESTGTCEAT